MRSLGICAARGAMNLLKDLIKRMAKTNLVGFSILK